MWGGINRRKFPRVHYKCLIHIRKKGSTKTISTRTENIGGGGICVIVADDLGLFQGVNVELDLENGIPDTIKCNGTVVWVVKKHGVKGKNDVLFDTGIEFVDMAASSEARIAKIIEKQLKET